MSIIIKPKRGSGAPASGALSQYEIAIDTTNDVLYYSPDGTNNVAIGSGGGGASAINDLTDVTIATVANGDLLVYNSTSGQWENGTAVQDLTVSGTLSSNNITDATSAGVTISSDESVSGFTKLVNAAGSYGSTTLLNTWKWSPAGILNVLDARTPNNKNMFMFRAFDTGTGDDGTHRVQFVIQGSNYAEIKGQNLSNVAVPVHLVGEYVKIDSKLQINRFDSISDSFNFYDNAGDQLLFMSAGAIEMPATYGGKVRYRTNGSELTTGDSGLQFETTGNEVTIEFNSHGPISLNGTQSGAYTNYEKEHGHTVWTHNNLAYTAARDQVYYGKPIELAKIEVGATAPASPVNGTLWLDTTTAGSEVLKTYRDEGAGLTWVNAHNIVDGTTFYDNTNHRIITMVNASWVALSTTSL